MPKPNKMTILIWTTKKPTKPGWYWWRSNSCFAPDILKVDGLGDKVVIQRDEEMLETPPGEWAGPLGPPE